MSGLCIKNKSLLAKNYNDNMFSRASSKSALFTYERDSKNETKYLNSQQSKDKIKWPCNLRNFM